MSDRRRVARRTLRRVRRTTRQRTDTPVTPDDPGWFPDPFGRYQYRWFDGTSWTDTVGSHGEELVDPRGTRPGRVPRAGADRGWQRRRVRRQVARAGGVGRRPAGDHGLLDADVLVINQRAKLIELRSEYAIHDDHGKQVGAVREVGQSTGRRLVRLLPIVDQYLGHHLEVTGADGVTILHLVRPATLRRSTVVVRDAGGSEIGRLIQQNLVGRARFDLRGAGGASVGRLHAENWPTRDYRVEDRDGDEVAHIHKPFEGVVKALLTTADDYVVRIPHPLPEPLRSLTLAAALCIDTALEQGVV